MFVKMGKVYVDCEGRRSEEISFLLRASEEHLVDYKGSNITDNLQLGIKIISLEDFLSFYIISLESKLFKARRLYAGQSIT